MADVEVYVPEDGLLDEMDRLSDLTVTVTAEMDRKTLSLGEFLDLEVDSVLEFGRPTGENIDVYAEDVLIGWGEILVMDGALTVRVASVRNPRLPGDVAEPDAD